MMNVASRSITSAMHPLRCYHRTGSSNTVMLVLGVVTAVGGGTIRDMALANGPVFWVKDPTDLVVAMITCVLTLLLVRQPRRLPQWVLPVLDAVGLAVFVGIGVNKAFRFVSVRPTSRSPSRPLKWT